MTDVEKQESQKTVVAFITGLLIGGLLVWVFSSTPESKQKPEEKKTDTEQVAKSEEVKKEEVVKTADSTVTKDTTVKADGEGKITVTDQAAGTKVALGALTFPTKSGWVVVRDYKDGVAGNVLGAALFDTEKGLTPTAVELMRATVSGNTYQVVFFNNEGKAEFELHGDKEVENTAVTFKAN
jgi:hypothetical protein